MSFVTSSASAHTEREVSGSSLRRSTANMCCTHMALEAEAMCSAGDWPRQRWTW